MPRGCHVPIADFGVRGVGRPRQLAKRTCRPFGSRPSSPKSAPICLKGNTLKASLKWTVTTSQTDQVSDLSPAHPGIIRSQPFGLCGPSGKSWEVPLWDIDPAGPTLGVRAAMSLRRGHFIGRGPDPGMAPPPPPIHLPALGWPDPPNPPTPTSQGLTGGREPCIFTLRPRGRWVLGGAAA